MANEGEENTGVGTRAVGRSDDEAAGCQALGCGRGSGVWDLGGTVRRHGTDKMDAGGGKGATRTAWSRGLEETTRRGACGDSRYPLLN